MKKYLINILVFAMLIIVLDIMVRFVAGFLIDHVKSGETFKNKYICDRTAEEILIMGSSRGVHHYDPRIIQDSLGLTCYNCAYDGCGSITAYGLLRILTEHYTPKVVVYDILPGFDYLDSDKDKSKYLGALKYFYDRDGIDSLFIKVNPYEQWKMKSWLYRLNSTSIQLLSEYMMNRNETVQGFLPQRKKMKYEPVIDEIHKHLEYDSLKMECFTRIIDICKAKGIILIFAVSPSYKKTDDYEYDYAKKLAAEKGIPFVSHYCDATLNCNKDYFYDSIHMNETGATVFTKKFVGEIRNCLLKR